MRRNRTGIQEREREREREGERESRRPDAGHFFGRRAARGKGGGTGKRARGAPRPVISTRRVQGRVGTGQPRGGTFGALPSLPPRRLRDSGSAEDKLNSSPALVPPPKKREIAPRCAIYACGLPFTRSRLPLRGSSRASCSQMMTCTPALRHAHTPRCHAGTRAARDSSFLARNARVLTIFNARHDHATMNRAWGSL